jgi:pimeloyl-ACP methyl ester carboxylesterase
MGQIAMSFDPPLPLLVFVPPDGTDTGLDGWYIEDFSRGGLTTMRPAQLDQDRWRGMILNSNDGRRWEIKNVRDGGLVGDWPRFIKGFVARLPFFMHHAIVEAVELERHSLEQIKDRTVEIIRANPDDWRDDEAIAGEAGEPRDEQEMLEELIAAVRAAPSVSGIIDALYR